MNTQILAGILSNFGFFMFMIGYMLDKKLELLRVYLIIGQIFLISWGFFCFDILVSYPLIVWNGLFLIINLVRLKKNWNYENIKKQLKDSPKDIINFITFGYYMHSSHSINER